MNEQKILTENSNTMETGNKGELSKQFFHVTERKIFKNKKNFTFVFRLKISFVMKTHH